jgi:hypothetical protein
MLELADTAAKSKAVGLQGIRIKSAAATVAVAAGVECGAESMTSKERLSFKAASLTLSI